MLDRLYIYSDQLSTSQECCGIKNTWCIQHPIWMRQGLHWTKR